MDPALETVCQVSETLTIRDTTKVTSSRGVLAMPSTVLVVEDDEILRSLLVEAISLLGVRVIDCDSADGALSMLEGSSSIALVMTDICMPGSMDGLELAQLIWSRWPCLPVIVMSGNRSVPEGMLPSHALFLRKPWTLDELHKAVRSCLTA